MQSSSTTMDVRVHLPRVKVAVLANSRRAAAKDSQGTVLSMPKALKYQI